MRTITLSLLLALAASAAVAQPPARSLFEDTPQTLTAEIVSADLSAPSGKLHVVDHATRQAWVVEGPSSNTLLRAGVGPETRAGTITVVGFQSKDKACAPECRLRVREITFPDGRKVFLGSAGVDQARL